MQGEKQRTIEAGLLLARTIMDRYLDKSWRVRVNQRYRKTYGTCDYRNRLIELNKWLLQYATTFHLSQLILHEVAHALTPNTGHSVAFRKKCKEINCYTIYQQFAWKMSYCFPDKKEASLLLE